MSSAAARFPSELSSEMGSMSLSLSYRGDEGLEVCLDEGRLPGADPFT